MDKEKYAWFLNAPPAPGQEEIPTIEQLKAERELLVKEMDDHERSISQ